ncbi:unnamed protein product [Boreogadus saida]
MPPGPDASRNWYLLTDLLCALPHCHPLTDVVLPMAPGPLRFCVILLQGQNPGVMWEYTLPRERKPDFTWGVARSDCSAACAGGRISTKAICLQDQKVQVNSSLCDPRTRRTVGSLLCNTQPCPAYSAVVQPTESGPEIEPLARLIRGCNDHLEHEWDQPSEREELIT